jgi:hypothetical protein
MKKESTTRSVDWGVYFFPERDTATPAIKIGFSKHPLKRLKQLQTGHPTKIGCEGWHQAEDRDDAMAIEKLLHKIFMKDRIRPNGEWFRYTDEIKKYIEHVKKDATFVRYFC